MIKLDYIKTQHIVSEDILSGIDTFSLGSVRNTRTERLFAPIDKALPGNMSVSFFSIKRDDNGKRSGKLNIGFSSKILKEKYPELITIDNILQCYQEIMEAANISFDVQHMFEHGKVIQAHVTNDIPVQFTKYDYNLIQSRIVNTSKWQPSMDRHSLGVISTRKAREWNLSLKIYNKEHESSLTRNYSFNNKYNIDTSKFEGKSRIEVKLQKPEAIIQRLGIEDNNINTVFNTAQHPIVSLINEIFDLQAITPVSIKHNYELSTSAAARVEFLENREWNWEKIEKEIRVRDGRQASQTIKTYRPLYDQYAPLFRDNISQEKDGRTILSKIVNELNNQWN